MAKFGQYWLGPSSLCWGSNSYIIILDQGSQVPTVITLILARGVREAAAMTLFFAREVKEATVITFQRIGP